MTQRQTNTPETAPPRERIAVGRRVRARAVAAAVVLASAAAACSDLGSSPETPTSIEMAPFAWPSVVIGDTLRDANGAVAPIRAIVRNDRGDTLSNTGTRYLYADYNRDSALVIDSATGIVMARKASTGDARIAARVGGALQVIQKIVVTVRPDSVEAGSTPLVLTTAFPDTGRAKATSNTTEALSVVVRNRQNISPVGVPGWLVRYALLRPANPTNDSTLSAWLVNDNGTASTLDTTDTGGNAGRRVRIRAAQFPAGAAGSVDTVIVQATVMYRGRPVPGSGLLVRGPVKRGTP